MSIGGQELNMKWSDFKKWWTDLGSKLIVLAITLIVTYLILQKIETRQSKALALNSMQTERMLNAWQEFVDAVHKWRSVANESREKTYVDTIKPVVDRVKIAFGKIGKANENGEYSDPFLKTFSEFHKLAKEYNGNPGNIVSDSGKSITIETKMDLFVVDISQMLKEEIDKRGGFQ